MKRRQRDLDTLRGQGQPLQDKGAGAVVGSEIARLQRKWQDVHDQVAMIQYPPVTVETGEGEITRTTFTVVQSSANRAGSPKSTSQMTVDIRRLSDQIADINRQLEGRELGGKDFDEFTKQEDILKVRMCKSKRKLGKIYHMKVVKKTLEYVGTSLVSMHILFQVTSLLIVRH